MHNLTHEYTKEEIICFSNAYKDYQKNHMNIKDFSIIDMISNDVPRLFYGTGGFVLGIVTNKLVGIHALMPVSIALLALPFVLLEFDIPYKHTALFGLAAGIIIEIASFETSKTSSNILDTTLKAAGMSAIFGLLLFFADDNKTISFGPIETTIPSDYLTKCLAGIDSSLVDKIET